MDSLYEQRLRERESGKADGPAWFGYIYRKNLVLFDAPKLIVQVISQSARFAFESHSLYFTGGGNGPYYGLRWLAPEEPRSLHYLQALLNSRLLNFFLHKISTPFRGRLLELRQTAHRPTPHPPDQLFGRGRAGGARRAGGAGRAHPGGQAGRPRRRHHRPRARD
ncbi:MAG: hypothetical protein IPM17_15815 [Verrucomicrobia bacterium]|nr:hypothetical protein [Verrucomicrobiota bacterium]